MGVAVGVIAGEAVRDGVRVKVGVRDISGEAVIVRDGQGVGESLTAGVGEAKGCCVLSALAQAAR
jgi:hypothetical protein